MIFLKKAVEIVKRVNKLIKSKASEAEVQLKILNFVINSTKDPNALESELHEIYEVLIFHSSETGQNIYSDFKTQDLEAVSDILAWILEVPKAVHRQNKEYLDSILGY